MEDILNAVPVWAKDELAQRYYVGSAGIILIAFCFYRAWREYMTLRGADPRNVLSPEQRRGRPPSTIRGWTRRAKRDAEEAKHKFWTLVYGAGRVALLGVGVPTAMLLLLTLYYSWFDPYAVAVIDARNGSPITDPTLQDAGIFVAGALAKGLLFDLIEVFQIHVSRLTNAPDNYIFSAAVLVYRAAANLFLIFVPIFLYATWRAMKGVEKEIEEMAAARKSEIVQGAGNAPAVTA